MAAQNSKKKSSRKSEAEDEKKRKEECERVYNEWMRKRGGRKMEIVGRREEGEDERVEEKGRRGEEMKRKPWREKVVHAENVMEARRARREEVRLDQGQLERSDSILRIRHTARRFANNIPLFAGGEKEGRAGDGKGGEGTSTRIFGISNEGRPMGSEPAVVCEWRCILEEGI